MYMLCVYIFMKVVSVGTLLFTKPYPGMEHHGGASHSLNRLNRNVRDNVLGTCVHVCGCNNCSLDSVLENSMYFTLL